MHPRFGLVIAAVAVACTAGRAWADATPSLALEPAPAGDRTLATETAQVRGSGHLRVRLLGDYAREPLVLLNQEQEYDRVVFEQLWLHALGSYSLGHRVLLGLDVPAVVHQSSGDPPPNGTTAPRPEDGMLLGDLRLGARLKVLGDAGDGVHLALAAAGWLPTGQDYAGDGAWRARGALLLDGVHDRFHWALDTGVRSRPGTRLPGVLPTRVGTALTASAAAGWQADAARRLALGAELVSSTTVAEGAEPFDPRGSLVQLLLTARVLPVAELELGTGFGPTVGQAPGAADLRLLAFVGWSPEQKPPPPDLDEDGVPDRTDACVALRGVPSPDPLLDGCPEVPPDFDQDEIPDQVDACPKEPGEPTGRRATHGCPKPIDSDGDRIVDREDSCPKEPGVHQADRSKNGCPLPPEPPPVARIEQEQIVIAEQVQFEHGTAELRAESDGVLEAVARVLREHPELASVEVQGHTDDTGTPELNQRLSEDRARAVVRWLTEHGIDGARLAPKGYGASKPLADNDSEEGRAKNRRVEFHVVDRSTP